MDREQKIKRIKIALKVFAGLLIAVVFIVGVPIGINEAYKIGGYETSWGATEAFLYYGAIFGGSATMAAVYLSIRNSNKIIKAENDRRELERKKDAMRQRNKAIENMLFDIYENVDSRRIYSRLNVADGHWKDTPMEFSRYYDDAQRMYNQFARFRHQEMELCNEEFGELYTYLLDYMSALWNILVSLVDYKRIKGDLEYAEQLNRYESLRWDVYRKGNDAANEHVEKVFADNGIKSLETIRYELLAKSKEIDEKYASVNLLQERYFALRIGIHDSIDKLEKQVEDMS